ncbi:hypothetical protein [Paenibacillus hubeiensis]|uniref:hypothetical protein n=1 Tax=Paenibacillus hubeiensis TaxID=3077330 RepID=UPI0031BAE16E
MSKMHDIHTVVYDPKELEGMMKERLDQMLSGETLEFKVGYNERSLQISRHDEDSFSAKFEDTPANMVERSETVEVVRLDEVSRFLKSHEEGIFLDTNMLATETISNTFTSSNGDNLMQNIDSKTLADIIVEQSYGETLSYPLYDWKEPAKEVTLKDLLKRIDGFPKLNISRKELLSKVKLYRHDSSNKLQYTLKNVSGIRTVEMENHPVLTQQRKEMILDQAAMKPPPAQQQMGIQM